MRRSAPTPAIRRLPGGACVLAGLLGVLLATTGPVAADPLGTAFVYQGRLMDAGDPVDVTVDLRFSLWTAETGGTSIGGEIARLAHPVTDGRFRVSLDFGAAAFAGSARWLQIAVRTPAGTGDYVTLAPRQEITATPYALQTRGLHVDEAGHVGIGTTSPARALDVVGSIDVNGAATTSVVRNADGVVSTVERTLQRYVVVATKETQGTSVSLDHEIFTDLCGDEDGCTIVVGVRNWQNPPTGLVTSRGPYRLFYAPDTGRWRTSNIDTSGHDGNGSVDHVLLYFGDVIFTDGEYVGFAATGDVTGFGLLNWVTYPDSDVFVTIED